MARQAKKGEILIQEINRGGLADSIFAGVSNSLYKFTGFDPHSKAGVIKVHQKLTKEAVANVPDEKCIILPTSVGNVLFFSTESGKVWEETSGGTYRLVHTIASANEDIAMSAREYNGYIYVATQSNLHRIAIVDCDDNDYASDFSTDWATFTNKNDTYHPMEEINLVLYIGDGNLVAQVDDGTFSANALDIRDHFTVSSLGYIGTDLLIGTIISDNVGFCNIFRWNTYSDSFSIVDTVPEAGVFNFIPVDNFVFVYAGTQGNIYFYNGSKLELYLKIQGDYSSTAKAKIKANASANMSGQVLMGLSNITGNPADCGIYMLGRHSKNYPFILTFPYPISQRDSGELVTTDVVIESIAVAGEDLYVSWEDTNAGVAGIDKLDYSNKLEKAYLETRVIVVDRESPSTFNKFQVPYYSLPASTDIDLFYKADYEASYNELTSSEGAKHDDDARNIIRSNEWSVEAVTLQLKVEAEVNGNDAPEFETISLFVR